MFYINPDVKITEPKWDADFLSELILSTRIYHAPEIGNPGSFWR